MPKWNSRVLPRIGGLVSLMVLALGTGKAQANVSSKLEATVHLKVLSYDRAAKRRSGGKLIIGVVYKDDNSRSKKTATRMAKAFASGRSVHGMKPRVVSVAYESGAMEATLRNKGVTAIYVAPDVPVGEMKAVAKSLHAPTFCGSRSQVEQGVAVGVFDKSGKLEIAINRPAARAAGMDIDADLLSLASTRF